MWRGSSAGLGLGFCTTSPPRVAGGGADPRVRCASSSLLMYPAHNNPTHLIGGRHLLRCNASGLPLLLPRAAAAAAGPGGAPPLLRTQHRTDAPRSKPDHRSHFRSGTMQLAHCGAAGHARQLQAGSCFTRGARRPPPFNPWR